MNYKPNEYFLKFTKLRIVFLEYKLSFEQNIPKN